MTQAEFASLEPGDIIAGPLPGKTPRRVISVGKWGKYRRAWKTKTRKEGDTASVGLAILNLSWTRRPYTIYNDNQANLFTIVKLKKRHPKTMEYGLCRILSGTPKRTRGVSRNEEAAISDELDVMEELKKRAPHAYVFRI